MDEFNNYNEFCERVKKVITEKQFEMKLLGKNCIKINLLDEDAYRILTKALSEYKYSWHSYESKQQRPIRVMVKNLPHSCKIEEIIKDLENREYKIIGAANKRSWKNKEPLNMFMLTFKAEEDINRIYEIKSILKCIVNIEPLRKNKLVVQCKSCQAYGHTQKYCGITPRCVICGRHHTSECLKPKTEPPKCVHCGNQHPANYRGCIIAKEMQKIKFKNMDTNSQQRNTPQHAKKQITNHLQTSQVKQDFQTDRSSKTYAQVVAGKKTNNNSEQENDLKQSILLILKKVTKIESSMVDMDCRIGALEGSTKNLLRNRKDE